ncbi:MAG: hypothetical protein WAM70_17390 [Pyrinomonadaceae bacterium]
MPGEKNKWIDAVGKLITLTQERKLLWHSTDSYENYQTEYGGKVVRLHWSHQDDEKVVRLALMDPKTGVEWAFPSSALNEHLMDAVRYQLVGVGDFLDNLLTQSL